MDAYVPQVLPLAHSGHSYSPSPLLLPTWGILNLAILSCLRYPHISSASTPLIAHFEADEQPWIVPAPKSHQAKHGQPPTECFILVCLTTKPHARPMLIDTVQSSQNEDSPLQRSAGNKPAKGLHACVECKRRKIRCDGKQPCDRCQSRRSQSRCVYDHHRQRIVPSKRLVIRT